MPRSGSGIYQFPAGSIAVPNTPISSVAHNAILTDLQADLNAPRPVSAGGTGATSPASAFEALSPMTARGDLVMRGASVSERIPIGAAGTVLSSDGLDPIWKVGAAAATEDAAGMVEIATEAENAERASATLVVVPKYNPLPPGHLTGCGLANDATDMINNIDIAAGKVRDSIDAANIILAAGITKRLNAAWSVGTNLGGLDTGTVTNGTYHVWLIKRSDTGVVDALFSTSASAPTMPTSYDFKRRIGSIIRAGGTIVQFTQVGDEFGLNVPVGDVDTNPGTASIAKVVTTVPLGISVGAMLSITAENNATATQYLNVATQFAAVPTASLFDIKFGQDAGQANSIWRIVRTNAAAQIHYRLSASIASTRLTFVTLGWIDTRGRI